MNRSQCGSNMKIKGFISLIISSIFILLSNPTTAYSQNWGMSLGISTEKVVFGDVLYRNNAHFFHFGLGYQLTDATGEEKSERKTNYGLSTSGSGDKFYTVDLGYGYEIIDTIELFVELSIGQRKYYTNYIDKRFKDGGYHMIDRDEMITGLGVGASYSISSQFKVFASYNSIRKLGVGVRYIFNLY